MALSFPGVTVVPTRREILQVGGVSAPLIDADTCLE